MENVIYATASFLRFKRVLFKSFKTGYLVIFSKLCSSYIFRSDTVFCFVGKFVIGRVIKAMQANWHPDCFRCEICNDGLADSGFVKNAGR